MGILADQSNKLLGLSMRMFMLIQAAVNSLILSGIGIIYYLYPKGSILTIALVWIGVGCQAMLVLAVGKLKKS